MGLHRDFDDEDYSFSEFNYEEEFDDLPHRKKVRRMLEERLERKRLKNEFKDDFEDEFSADFDWDDVDK